MAFLTQNLIPSFVLTHPYDANQLDTSKQLHTSGKHSFIDNELTVARNQLLSRLLPLNSNSSSGSSGSTTTVQSSSSEDTDLEQLLNRYFSVLYGFIFAINKNIDEEKKKGSGGGVVAVAAEREREEAVIIDSSQQSCSSSTMVLQKPSSNNHDQEKEEKEKVEQKTQFSQWRFSVQYQWTMNNGGGGSSSSSSGSEKLLVSDSMTELVLMCLTYVIKLKTLAQGCVTRTEQNYNVKRAFQLLLKCASILQFADQMSSHVTTDSVNHVQFSSPSSSPSSTTGMTTVLPFQWTIHNTTNSKNAIHVLWLATLAEVQEMAFYASLDKVDEKPGLVAQVARNMVQKYESAYNSIATSSSPNDTVSTSWFNHLYYKYLCAQVLFHVYAAVHYNKESENGVAICSVNQAESVLNGALKDHVKKLVTAQADMKPYKQQIEERTKYLTSLVARYKDKYQTENTLVFHQRIPTEVPEEHQITGQSLGKVQEYQYPELASEWSTQLYNNLNLPPIQPSRQQQNNAGKSQNTQDKLMNEIEVQSISGTTNSGNGSSGDNKSSAQNNKKTAKQQREADGFSLCNIL